MLALNFIEKFLKWVFLRISISLIHLFYVEYEVWTELIHELLEDECILGMLIASDSIEHVA